MAITLYTSRVILDALGVDDFGVYNVVGGLSFSFIFFSSALTNATQRFLNFEHGAGHTEKLNNIFNLSLLIYSSIALVVVVIGVTAGTWFVKNKLLIPEGTIPAACIVLYMTLLSLLFSFIGSVYESILISHENMKIYAYLGIIDAVGKLIVAYLITQLNTDRLIVYSIILALIQIFPKLYLIYYCRQRYTETQIRYYWDSNLFREMFAFAGWNIYGTGVWMINQQGINIVLNMFFGPAVNAARGVASQVTNAINNFCVNFFTAVRPQIIKTYAAREMDKFTGLIYNSSKFSVYLLWLLCLPVFLRIDYILSLWLKEVPADTALFIKWVIVYMIFDTLNNPLWSAIQAVGNLKKTILYGSSYYLLAFPLSYLALRIGSPAWIVYPILSFVRATYLIIVFKILAEYVPLTGHLYFQRVILPITLVIAISFAVAFFINPLFPETFMSLVFITIISCFLTVIIIFTFGINQSERQIIFSKIKDVIKKHKG